MTAAGPGAPTLCPRASPCLCGRVAVGREAWWGGRAATMVERRGEVRWGEVRERES